MGATAFFGVVSLFEKSKAASAIKRSRKEQTSARKRTQKTQQRIADVKANAAKRKAIAAKRKKEGANIAAAQATGTLESSVFKGVESSAATTFAGQLSDAARIGEEVKETNIFTAAAEDRAQSFLDSASGSQTTADIFGTVGDIAGKFSSPDKPRVTEKESIFNK